MANFPFPGLATAGMAVRSKLCGSDFDVPGVESRRQRPALVRRPRYESGTSLLVAGVWRRWRRRRRARPGCAASAGATSAAGPAAARSAGRRTRRPTGGGTVRRPAAPRRVRADGTLTASRSLSMSSFELRLAHHLAGRRPEAGAACGAVLAPNPNHPSVTPPRGPCPSRAPLRRRAGVGRACRAGRAGGAGFPKHARDDPRRPREWGEAAVTLRDVIPVASRLPPARRNLAHVLQKAGRMVKRLPRIARRLPSCRATRGCARGGTRLASRGMTPPA